MISSSTTLSLLCCPGQAASWIRSLVAATSLSIAYYLPKELCGHSHTAADLGQHHCQAQKVYHVDMRMKDQSLSLLLFLRPAEHCITQQQLIKMTHSSSKKLQNESHQHFLIRKMVRRQDSKKSLEYLLYPTQTTMQCSSYSGLYSKAAVIICSCTFCSMSWIPPYARADGYWILFPKQTFD